MSFCLPLLRLQISDYESDAPGGRSSLQLLAKCSSAHYVPRGGRQRQGSKPTAPPFKKQVSLMWTHELKWLKLCREVLRMSNWWGCFFLKENKPNGILGESSQNGKTDKGTPVSISRAKNPLRTALPVLLLDRFDQDTDLASCYTMRSSMIFFCQSK